MSAGRSIACEQEFLCSSSAPRSMGWALRSTYETDARKAKRVRSLVRKRRSCNANALFGLLRLESRRSLRRRRGRVGATRQFNTSVSAVGDCAAPLAQLSRPSWSVRRRPAASSGSSCWHRGRPHRVAARSRTSSAERSGSPLQMLARHRSIHSTCPPQERSDPDGWIADPVPIEVIGWT